MMFRSPLSICLIVVVAMGGAFAQTCDNNVCRIEEVVTAQLKDQKNEILKLAQCVRDLKSEVAKIAARACPPGFVYNSSVNSCYKVIAQSLNWDQSAAKCTAEHAGAHLFFVTSAEKHTMIVDRLNSLTADEVKICNPAGNGASFFTGGQRIVPTDCSSPVVWKKKFYHISSSHLH